jgi:hypothetical protein
MLGQMYNYRHSWVSEDNVQMTLRRVALKSFRGIVAVVLATCVSSGQTKKTPVDPGVRGGPAGAGAPLAGLRTKLRSSRMACRGSLRSKL